MIGNRIKERRCELGLTQEELAKKMGYKSKSTINKIELGINDVNQSKIMQFAAALDTTVEYLMGWDSEPKRRVDFDLVATTKAVDKFRNVRLEKYIESFIQLSEQNKGIVENLTNSLLDTQGDKKNED